jgi:hypothetical protein
VSGDGEGAGCEGKGLRVVSCVVLVMLLCSFLVILGGEVKEVVPLLCVMTPFRLTSSMPCSSIKRSTAWKAPRTLNAPMRWKFSHLKNRRIFGFAGSCPSHCVPFSASCVCGVDARFDSVVFVRMGVRWIWGLMSL